MAATLPAINSPREQSPSIQQHQMASPTSKAPTSVYMIQTPQKRLHGKKDRDIEDRRHMLRAQQPHLSQRQTTQYRHTYKHNLCLDMLQEGFHKSFAELFALIQQQNEERQLAGPESLMWTQSMLENEPEKLEMLKTYLTAAEEAFRQGAFAEVYQCQYKLARYFQGTGDKWLVDHFFASCLATGANVQGDEGRMAAEGHCNVGLALEESGENFEAAENFELFYKLAKNKEDWTLEDGSLMHAESCKKLARIYTTIAMQFEKAKDLQQYLSYLLKAYNMCKESGDKKLEGEASFRLGQAYEKNGDPDTALLYLNGYLETCRVLGDSGGLGKACEAIARSYDSQGKVEESIKYLEMFVEVAEGSKDDKAISQACSDLGAMFNSLGRYEQAVEYFNKSYNISRAMNDTEAISSSRVLYGVAVAHKMLDNYAKHTELGHRPCLERLIEWKDNRGDDFQKAIPEPVTEEKTVEPETKPAIEAPKVKKKKVPTATLR